MNKKTINLLQKFDLNKKSKTLNWKKNNKRKFKTMYKNG